MSNLTIQSSQYLKGQYALLEKALDANIEAHLQLATPDDLERIVKACSGTLFTHVGYKATACLRLEGIEDGTLIFTNLTETEEFKVSDLDTNDKFRLLEIIEATI